jgi:hypothetical protein
LLEKLNRTANRKVSGGKPDVSDHAFFLTPIPAKTKAKHRAAARKPPPKRFIFETESPIKLPAILFTGELHGYIASDPEPMLHPLDEPVYAPLTDDSDDSAAEFLASPDIYPVKKRFRNRHRRKHISLRKTAAAALVGLEPTRQRGPYNLPDFYLDYPEDALRTRSYSEDVMGN